VLCHVANHFLVSSNRSVLHSARRRHLSTRNLSSKYKVQGVYDYCSVSTVCTLRILDSHRYHVLRYVKDKTRIEKKTK
jgi:hypothetical protein